MSPPPGGDDTPPAPSPPGGDDTPPAPSPPSGGDGAPGPGPPPGDGAPTAAAGTLPGAASSPKPNDAATGVTVGGPLLSWAAAPRALSYDVYWGAENTDLDTPINTSFTFLTIAASADLAHETLYYWRVDAKNEAGTTRGAVWSFTTAAAPAPAPPAGETPPVGLRQAPAWPAEAADLKIEAVVGGDSRRKSPPHLTLPEPTGNPTPEVSVKGLKPLALIYVPNYCATEGCFGSTPQRILAPRSFYGARGTITMVASNSEGRAELEVPYNLTCRYTLAEILGQYRGSWVPVPGTTPGKYTALTIGDTITTVPASSGGIDRDWAAELERRGETPGPQVNGHTLCSEIFHPDWTFARSYGSQRWNYGKHPFDQVGCERVISVTPREGDSTDFVPAGCNDPPYGDPP